MHFEQASLRGHSVSFLSHKTNLILDSQKLNRNFNGVVIGFVFTQHNYPNLQSSSMFILDK